MEQATMDRIQPMIDDEARERIAGTAASRAKAIGWALARLRERPAYTRLSERARELEELKARS